MTFGQVVPSPLTSTPFRLQATPFRQSHTSGPPIQSVGLTSTLSWDTEQPLQCEELHRRGSLGKYLLLNNIDNILNYAEALQRKTRRKSDEQGG